MTGSNPFVKRQEWESKGIICDKAIVVSNHLIASLAGLETIAHGGNAIDATISTLLALSVVEPMMVSPFGGGVMLIHLSKSNKTIFLDNYASVPREFSRASISHLRAKAANDKTLSHYLKIATPGALKGWEYVSNKYGQLPFKRLFEAAIRLAENGFPASPYYVDFVERWKNDLTHFPHTSKIYLPNGKIPRVGEIIRQTDFGNTLKIISEEGVDLLYFGELGKKITSFVEKNGGYLTIDDLGSYKVFERNILEGKYRNFDIVTANFPSIGGSNLLKFLKFIEGYPISDADLLPFSSKYLSLLIKAYENCFKVTDEQRNIKSVENSKNNVTTKNFKDEKSCTTHTTIIDNLGNIVCATQTLHKPFGSKVIAPGTGLLLNDMLNLQDPNIDFDTENVGGSRITSFMAPALVFHGNNPIIALGAAGGDRIFGSVAQAIINVLDFGMSLQEAIDAPRIWARGGYIEMERTFPHVNKIKSELQLRGHKPILRARIGAGINGIQLQQNGFFRGSGCWRSDSSPVGSSGGWARSIKSIMELNG